MAPRGQAVTITYYAWNSTTNQPQTGDRLNHVLKWKKDGQAAADITGTPTPTEVDATNCPGLYAVTIPASDTNCRVGTLHGKSNTLNVYLMPEAVYFESNSPANWMVNG